MVTITNYKKRQNSEGKEFFTLVLQGDVELIKSAQTGRFYASSKTTSITSTFDEVTCKALIGKTLPGKIEKVQCDSYEYVVPETGEVIELTHTYQYVPENTASTEEAIFGHQHA